MESEDFYFLGRIVKTSGYKGDLVFFFDVDDIGFYKDLEAVFVTLGGELIPFAINSIQVKGQNAAIVNLSDVETDEEAVALVGSELYLPKTYLPPLGGNKFYFHEVIGFTVYDNTHGNIGTVKSFIDQGPQQILIIQFSKKEILVPVSDEILQEVDRKNKTIKVNTPEGLVEMYTNEK